MSDGSAAFASQAHPSNVVLFTDVPAAFFQDLHEQEALLDGATRYGEVVRVDTCDAARMVRVVFLEQEHAVTALTRMNGWAVTGTPLNVAFGQPEEVHVSHMQHLQVPPLEKQFLISPPPSPPVGWAPIPEDPPVVDHELQAVHDSLTQDKGKVHILLEGSGPLPVISLQDCSDETSDNSNPVWMRGKHRGTYSHPSWFDPAHAHLPTFALHESDEAGSTHTPAHSLSAIPQTRMPPRGPSTRMPPRTPKA